MRYLMATSWSRDSMWISLARRSSALKMVVSTSLMTGAMSAIGGGQLVDGEGFVLVALFRHHVQREAFGDFFEHALRLLGLLEQLGDLRERGHLDPQLLVAAAASARRSGSGCADRRARFRASRSAPAWARSCSGTSDPRGWSGTGRDRSRLRAGPRTRSGSAPPWPAPAPPPPPDPSVSALSDVAIESTALTQRRRGTQRRLCVG